MIIQYYREDAINGFEEWKASCRWKNKRTILEEVGEMWLESKKKAKELRFLVDKYLDQCMKTVVALSEAQSEAEMWKEKYLDEAQKRLELVRMLEAKEQKI